MASELRTTVRELPRILIAEDDPISRKVLERYLEEEGYPYVSTTNGREALEEFGRGVFPIVITDWLMPEMDGTALCSAIRSRPADHYTFLILQTARNSQEALISGLEAGADDYIFKPVHQAELRVRLKGACRILDLENSLRKSLEEIKELSVHDPLTGTFNRRYMDSQLLHEIRRSFRYLQPLSVIICDLDHFKRVNDTYGHDVGDEALIQCVADVSSSIRRDIDWMARYGGEEFVIVLPMTEAAGCRVVAERIRKRVAAHPVSSSAGEIMLTVSLGAVTIMPLNDRESTTPRELIHQADNCLYQAKRSGRNRVVAELYRQSDASTPGDLNTETNVPHR